MPPFAACRCRAAALQRLPLALLLGTWAAIPAAAAPSNVSVQGRQLLVDGVPIHLKGVNWNPIPKGKMHPFDLDYLGYVENDSAIMQAAGINAIRTYECVCDTRVLDVLWEHGIYVLNTIFAWGGKSMASVLADVDAVKDHPAVLMWVLGNEWNYNGCYYGLTHDECAAMIREATELVKMNDAAHPVASIYGRMPTPRVLQSLPKIDIWGINFYDGADFSTDYWETTSERYDCGHINLFQCWANLSTLPLFVGEYGADAWDTINNRYDAESQAFAINALAGKLVDNTALREGGVCLGGMVFEFADEWWKDGSGSPSTQETDGHDWGGGPYPDMRFNEEWWGLVDIDRNPRPAYHAYANVSRPIASEYASSGSLEGAGMPAPGSVPPKRRLEMAPVHV